MNKITLDKKWMSRMVVLVVTLVTHWTWISHKRGENLGLPSWLSQTTKPKYPNTLEWVTSAVDKSVMGQTSII